MSLEEQERLERRRGYERKYYRNPANRHKDRARRMVAEAVSTGRLIPSSSCERCGGGADTEAHHPDYSQPLSVQWLCVPCHREIHRKTHCKHGHEYTPENTYFHNGGKRFCAECQRIRGRAKRLGGENRTVAENRLDGRMHDHGFDPPRR